MNQIYGRGSAGSRIAESWEISVHPDGECATEEGVPFSEYLAALPFSVDGKGNKFPLLIKYIDAAKNLSVQVHPDDEYARRNGLGSGKTEFWYIIHAEAGAGIYCGFRRDTDRAEFLRAAENGTVEDLLHFMPVRAGDCCLVQAGTVHAICAGCVVCEVQQSSNVTFRIYDYHRADGDGKPRPLHIGQAADVLNYRAFEDHTACGVYERCAGGRLRTLTRCSCFRCRELILNGEFTERGDNSFVAVNVLEGKGQIDGGTFSDGDSFFVPRGEKYRLQGNAKLLLTDL